MTLILLILSVVSVLFPPKAGIARANEDVAELIARWEREACAADLAGDKSFYEAGLADDWSDGMSNGEFQTKHQLIADMAEPSKNSTLSESLSDIKVRVYGSTAIATYTERYEALIDGKKRSRTIITTDTFVKLEGMWKQVAAHSSQVSNRGL